MPRLLVCVLLALGCAASPAVAAERVAPVPRGFFGVIADGPALERSGLQQAPAIASSGTRTIRVAAYWNLIEPVRGAIFLQYYDAVVLDAARRGIAVLPVVQRTPVWAAADPDAVGSPPRDPADFARFLRVLVARYGPAGSLWREHPEVAKRAIRRWQVWNEPDITKFWSEVDWAPGYVRLLRAASTALRRADRGVTVVAAGLTNQSWVDLRKLYRAGAKGSFDVAAVHPFSRYPRNVLKIVRLARGEMVRAGDAKRGLMLTEVSWSSGAGHSIRNYGWETSEAGQAARIREVLPALAAVRKRFHLEGMFWYTWLSGPVGGLDSFDYGGLRRLSGGVPVDKPALRAWRTTLARLTR